MTRPGIEPRFPGPLANTITIMQMSGLNIGPYSLLLHSIGVIMGEMEINGYSTLPRYPELNLQHQFSIILKIFHFDGVLPLSREYSQRTQYPTDEVVLFLETLIFNLFLGLRKQYLWK